MPKTKTRPPPPPAAEPAAAVALAAAAFAAAELAAGLALGLLAPGRAEAWPFLAARPWLLLAAAVALADRPLAHRLAVYAAGLALASLGETLLLGRLGAASPWAGLPRALAVAAVAVAAVELLVQAGRSWLGRWGVAALGALLLLAAGASGLLEGPRGADPPPGALRPRVLLMSGLPLAWGEAGPFDPRSRPASAYVELQEYFQFEPVDVLDEAGLGRGRLLLLAQPQRLAPAELAALDLWIRGGGKALILDDPALAWPSALPLGDIRRPPPVGLLGPLLDHWGLSMAPPAAPGLVGGDVGGRRLALESPGRLDSAAGSGCRVGPVSWAATCRLGRGRAIVVADADLLRDDLWAPRGARRRVADNPYAVADWLDSLAGLRRAAPGGRVRWAGHGANPWEALALALVPVAACAAAGLLIRRRRRR